MGPKPYVEPLLSKVSNTDIENRVVVTHHIKYRHSSYRNTDTENIEPANHFEPKVPNSISNQH